MVETGPLCCKKISTASRRTFIPKNCSPSGPDQRQSCRSSGQGRSECADSGSYHPRVGQVLSSAVWWLLHPAVDRRCTLFPGLQHPGSYGGRAGQRQREKMHVKAFSILYTLQLCQSTHLLYRLTPTSCSNLGVSPSGFLPSEILYDAYHGYCRQKKRSKHPQKQNLEEKNKEMSEF